MELVGLLSCLLFFTTTVFSCSPEHYVTPTLPRMAHFSHVVLTGYVLKTFPSRFGDSAYDVQVEVSCIYKSKDYEVSPIVNITEAGFIPGMCHSSDLKVGENYIIFADKRENADGEIELSMRGKEWNMTEQHLKDLSKICGLSLMPLEEGKDMKDKHPECPAVEEDCTTYDPEEERNRTVIIAPPIPELEATIQSAEVVGSDSGVSIITSSIVIILSCLAASL